VHVLVDGRGQGFQLHRVHVPQTLLLFKELETRHVRGTGLPYDETRGRLITQDLQTMLVSTGSLSFFLDGFKQTLGSINAGN
jgi:hypothetical protein